MSRHKIEAASRARLCYSISIRASVLYLLSLMIARRYALSSSESHFLFFFPRLLEAQKIFRFFLFVWAWIVSRPSNNDVDRRRIKQLSIPFGRKKETQTSSLLLKLPLDSCWRLYNNKRRGPGIDQTSARLRLQQQRSSLKLNHLNNTERRYIAPARNHHSFFLVVEVSAKL